MQSLWGSEFDIQIETKQSTKNILNKIKKVKKEIVLTEESLKKKSLPIEDRLSIINENVNRILGVYKENTAVIKTIDQLKEYIDKALSCGIIAIDTETNNSLDPLTCKLMGPCIYVPGLKNAYIPINHTDLEGNRLDWQLTEQDIYNEFSRLKDIDIIAHNGSFDYKVLYCTIGWKMPVTYDTLIAAKLLDENDRAGLKYLYIKHIDPSIEHYSIDHLFENIEYKYVDPDIFALYAATDAFMTYKLREYQLKQFEKEPELFNLFKTVEMPVIFVSTSMELEGISLDEEYSKRLSIKYHKKLDDINKEINIELDNLKETILEWRLTPEANKKINDKKSKNEQLKNPVELTSPTQLAILLYDILKVPVVDKKLPRGTGEDILEALKDKYKICELILKQRTLLKLLTAFIDVLPEQLSLRDNRIHSSFNSLGAKTGRFSCSGPNLQQIPSHQKDIRMMFKATSYKKEVFEENNYYIVDKFDEVETDNGYILANSLKVGDKLVNSDKNFDTIENIEEKDNNLYLYIGGVAV